MLLPRLSLCPRKKLSISTFLSSLCDRSCQCGILDTLFIVLKLVLDHALFTQTVFRLKRTNIILVRDTVGCDQVCVSNGTGTRVGGNGLFKVTSVLFEDGDSTPVRHVLSSSSSQTYVFRTTENPDQCPSDDDSDQHTWGDKRSVPTMDTRIVQRNVP